ncbi:expressed unknown protein [Seminavis robusta]|uniref:Uncharacterized protein n=1 Tax=Seminavis robusta TaxID=568900 RepID=A0A9N8F2K3_9STRA|nr:expressed unknown protein [Seminavis robusta]|eukprot:Sro2442_g327770.1 n/a (304) ;mRNA; r:1133-2178
MRALFDKDGSDKLHGTETVDTYAVPDGDDDASLDLSSLELDQKRGDMDRSNHTSFSNHWDESQEETNQRRKRLERMREERDMQVRMIQMNKALEESNKTSVFGQKLNQLFGSSLPNLDVSFSVRASGSLNDLEGPLGVAFGKSRPRKTLLDLGGGSMRDLFTIQQDQESTEYDTSNASKPGPLSRLMAKRNNFNNLSDEPANTSGEEVKEGSKSPKTTPKKKRFDDLSGDEDAMQDSASSLPSLNLLGADDFEAFSHGSQHSKQRDCQRGRADKTSSPGKISEECREETPSSHGTNCIEKTRA